MKYMGSKRAMLQGGLDKTIAESLDGKGRFFDLFTGSGSVACHVAERFPVEVIATDLQEYAAVLARSVIGRTAPLSFDAWAPNWIAAAISRAERQSEAVRAASLQNRFDLAKLPDQAARARKLASASASDFVRAYGGWYFSPWQALLLDALRQEADPTADWYDTAVGAVIQTASRCAASPGHTAQPFKAETGAAPFLLESWRKDIIAQVTVSASALCGRHAKTAGRGYSADANDVVRTMREGDVAFIDPPYSSVHYSRFYHVLESLARGQVGDVSGMGRYPASDQRPSSEYSIPTRAEDALSQLLARLADVGATAIVTFPAGEASNRLSGVRIQELARPKFHVEAERFLSRFSTLGGDQKHRTARQEAEEMILTLRPRELAR